MSAKVRSFVAVGIADEVRRAVGDFTAELKKRCRGVRWVRAENLHLTLKFLGGVDSGKIPEIAAALDGAARGHRPFTLTLRGAGIFPPRGRPRVVWLDCAEGGGEITAVQSDVERCMEPLGFPPEGKSYTPHLTIGRIKDPRQAADIAGSVAETADREWGKTVVDRVHLMRSDLFPTGPRYSILHAARLGS